MIKQNNSMWAINSGSEVLPLYIAEYFSFSGIQIGVILYSWGLISNFESSRYLSITMIASLILGGLISIPTGVVLDRMNQKKFIVIVSILRGICALLIAMFLWLFGNSVIVYGLGFITMHILTVQFSSARRVLTPHLVGSDEVALAKVNGSFSAIDPLTKFLIPPLVGALMLVIPVPILVMTQAILFFTAGWFIYRYIRFCSLNIHKIKDVESNDLLSGVKMIIQSKFLIRILISGSLAATCITVLVSLLLPLIAKDLSNGLPVFFGVLLSAIGVGSIIGARVSTKWLIKLKIPILFKLRAVLVLLLVIFSILVFFVNAVVYVFGFTIVGFLMTIALVLIETALQLHASPEVRGRFFTAFDVLFKIPVPVGMVVLAFVSESFGWKMALNWIVLLAGLSVAISMMKSKNKKVNKDGVHMLSAD